MRRLPAILLLNFWGIALFFSWYLPAHHGVWWRIDSSIFLFFNQIIAQHRPFAYAVAITNLRAFDALSLLAMGLLYSRYYLRTPPEQRGRPLAIGVVMLLSATVLNQLGHLLPVSHVSPSLFFKDAPGVVRIAQFTDLPTKDASMDSFPGDHGMMLMIFAGYMLRYYGGRAFAGALAILLLFSLPRVTIGAHWFSDIAVGSLSVVLVGMSWWLMTGVCDSLVGWLGQRLGALRVRKYQ